MAQSESLSQRENSSALGFDIFSKEIEKMIRELIIGDEDSMMIKRWQAPLTPDRRLISMMLAQEGLEPIEEVYDPSVKIPEHRHPFHEIRVIVSGELLFNIAGHQFLLRPGDRVEVPAHTKHSHTAQGSEVCVSLYVHQLA